MRLRTPLIALILCASLVPARADDDDEPGVRFDGTARVGWRFLSDRGEGRFLQDVGLDDGLRLFDLDLELTDERDERRFEELSASVHDIGGREGDGSLRFRNDAGVSLNAGLSRDVLSYRASGDPFPVDTTRDRAYTRLRFAPRSGLTVRLDWDRSERDGVGFASQDTDRRELPQPAGVNPDLVATRRPFDQRFDTFTAGVDLTSGAWRFGLTESVRRGRVVDERLYDVPAASRGTDPVRERFRRSTTSQSTTTVAKIGLTALDGDLESTLFVSHTRHPVDAKISGDAAGFDNDFSGATPKGAYEAVFSGRADVDRDVDAWTLETVAEPLDDWELIASLGQEDTIDDATLRLVERRRYARADVGRENVLTGSGGRTTDRTDRASLEALWDVADDVRLRAGRELYRQDIEAPLETRGQRLFGSEVRGETWRWIAGIDAKPAKRLKVSVLARRAEEDEPHATTSAENADEAVARIRWNDGEALSLSGVYRYRGFQTREAFDSTARAESASLAATWADGPWTFEGSLSQQTIDTRADTSFFVFDGVTFRQIAKEIQHRTRDSSVTAFVEREFSSTVRASFAGSYVDTSGDIELSSHELRLAAEYDIAEDVTLIAAVTSWRYAEHGRSRDDYDAEALELSVRFRF